MAANLQRLAQTGLPIYVSELEVAFADDARQANVMSQLFPVMWENPNLVGVTHWGYRQGAMWRADGYLVRSNGTHRPALDWLLCYMAGNPSCSVPEYVPAPRTGDSTVIMRQAEDYDAAQGLIGLGSSVAYTDNGDWERFDRVVFDANWNKLSVTYAKGSTDTTSSITLHLDSLESAPVATVPLAPTGGWGTSVTTSVDWTSLAGEHTLYVRFNGGYGVANLDSLTFSAPSSNLVKNGTFEVLGTQGWNANNGTLEVSTARAHSGAHSLRHYDRAQAWAGTQAVLTPFVTRGATYPVSFWVSVAQGTSSSATQPVKLTQTWNCGSGQQYAQLTNSVNVTDGQWVQLKGVTNVPECAVTDFRVYVEGPAIGAEVYVDDVKILVPEANIILPGTFEGTGSGSTEGWGSWIGSSVITQDRAHGGLYSLSSLGTATARPHLVRSLSGLVPGQSYVASMWLSTNSASSQYVHLQGQYKCSNGTTQYPWLANPNVPAGTGWVKLAAVIDVPACTGGTLEWYNLYAEAGNAGTFVVYLDDASVNHFSFEQL